MIGAVELELPPVATTAVLVQADRLVIEKLARRMRGEGWLPRGASPLPGTDRTAWVCQARALVASREAELEACRQQRALRSQLAHDRQLAVDRDRRRAQRAAERAQRPSRFVLDQIGGIF